MMGLRVGLAAAALLTVHAPAAGQGWIVDASAGAAEYEALAGDVGTVNAIVGVRRDGPVWVTASAGVPLDSAAVPWGSAGIGGRWTGWRGRVGVGVDGAAVGFGYRADAADATGGGATVIALPFVALPFSGGRVEARTGVMHHSAFFDGESVSRTVLDSGLRAFVAIGPGLLFGAEGRAVSASESTYPYAGFSLDVVRGAVNGWARGGRWFGDALEGSGWGVGARMALPGRLALRASFERETDDPLYWNGARSSWSVGISRGLGRRSSLEARLPPPESFRTSPGIILLRLPSSESIEAPSVAGDFTGWEAVPMQLSDGAWEVRFDLAPGIYHYSFRRADGSWFLPESVTNRVDDGFGGVNAVLVVVAP
jgi:hypothetical protein